MVNVSTRLYLTTQNKLNSSEKKTKLGDTCNKLLVCHSTERDTVSTIKTVESQFDKSNQVE